MKAIQKLQESRLQTSRLFRENKREEYRVLMEASGVDGTLSMKGKSLLLDFAGTKLDIMSAAWQKLQKALDDYTTSSIPVKVDGQKGMLWADFAGVLTLAYLNKEILLFIEDTYKLVKVFQAGKGEVPVSVKAKTR